MTRVSGCCGGRPVIRGTRFTVSSVVFYALRQGMTPEELVREFPHLTLAQVYDALSYYYDHKEEIDQEMRANTARLQPLTRRKETDGRHPALPRRRCPPTAGCSTQRSRVRCPDHCRGRHDRQV
ncbi:MAG: DUF433 domain-containing protein, partial [Bacillota bacterium]|nr:DUF433 domain-containing protein [Bacillota bacterium]